MCPRYQRALTIAGFLWIKKKHAGRKASVIARGEYEKYLLPIHLHAWLNNIWNGQGNG